MLLLISPGPGAATVLADYGADVVKIEALTGDGYRKLKGAFPIDYNWLLTSRNKRSIALDLGQPEARNIVHRLARGADVFLTNFIGTQLAKYELEYDRLKGNSILVSSTLISPATEPRVQKFSAVLSMQPPGGRAQV
ncbi:MAG: hypothetical protein CM1200mP9_09850 [Gammaproteobacteria bacterium]|nr:MAG: hypothetical protein CM1200mP9_09850 [Gammaproteobacteria bacterium]